MSDELLTLYTKEEPEKAIKCGRAEYYDNDFTTYKNHYPALIDVFLFNNFGEVLLQRRGRNKRKNPYRLHTTIGGHINWGEEPSFSLVHEAIEELGAPVLLFSKDEYDGAVKKLYNYTNKAALVYNVKEFFRNFPDSNDEDKKTIKDRIWLYFGLYNGPVDTPDRESAGYEWTSLDVLKEEIATNPSQLTSGLIEFFETFEEDMRAFTEKYCRE